MSTTALNGMNPSKVLYPTGGFAPRRPDIRTIVREEIERQKKLDELDEKYKNGEISKFEYYTNRMALFMPTNPPVIYNQMPTVEYMA